MVTVETYDDKGNVVATETRPNPVLDAQRAAVRDAILAIQPVNVTTLLGAQTEMARIKVALARLARAVASIEGLDGPA